jgi:hypothetical protein
VLDLASKNLNLLTERKIADMSLNEDLIKREDFYVDPAPEHMENDTLSTYFRSRFAEREALLESVDEANRERILRELKRISDLRNEYVLMARDGENIRTLINLRADWRAHATKSCKTNIKNLSSRVSSMKKLRKDTEWKRRREKWEYKILQNVKDWELQRPTAPWPELGQNYTPSGTENGPIDHPTRVSNGKNFDVSEITFERRSENDPFMNFETKEYPLQGILSQTDANPLRRLDGEKALNTIRYFHFPHNNMYWVQVGSSILEVTMMN